MGSCASWRKGLPVLLGGDGRAFSGLAVSSASLMSENQAGSADWAKTTRKFPLPPRAPAPSFAGEVCRTLIQSQPSFLGIAPRPATSGFSKISWPKAHTEEAASQDLGDRRTGPKAGARDREGKGTLTYIAHSSFSLRIDQ